MIARDKTKKRAGNFFTPPLLAAVTAERCLEALVSSAGDSQVPKLPEEILQLKIVDPAMGAGFFLLAACDYLTSALQRSLAYYQRSWPADRCAPLAVLLRRSVFKNCIFGVDKDSLAVHAARLSVALTADLDLAPIVGEQSPDNGDGMDNFKIGNALVGQPWSAEIKPSDSPHTQNVACALHFWPQERSDIRPASAQSALTSEQSALVDALAVSFKFFHWQEAFRSVFDRSRPGFDAVIGNPPWEIEKPNSREFFGRFDDRFWELSKQAALARQKQLCREQPQIADQWKMHQERFKLLNAWSKARFKHQGAGDMNAYKLFAELAYELTRDGGVVSLVVPAGIYSDKGTVKLRQLFLNRCRWLYLHGYSNSQGLFDIHRSFKFCVFAAIKGACTEAIEVSFLKEAVERKNPQECQTANDLHDHAHSKVSKAPEAAVFYSAERLRKFSPRWNCLFEIESQQEIEILEKCLAHSVSFRDAAQGGWDLRYARELDMTIDSKKFQQ
ncbi:MAG TPA: hypothetical protein V6C72_20230, partial [Chroococcales cyanobacterium]